MPHFFQSILRSVERMGVEEYALVFGLVLLAGFLCMRGFGSRSGY